MLDHVVLATPDIGATSDWIRRATGVTPSVGGAHVGRGTRNELCSFGDGTYLEVIGPDPDQPEPAEPRPFGIDAIVSPGVVTWCARVDGLAAHVSLARSRGRELTEPVPMQRHAPEGLLSWQLAFPTFGDESGLVPFFIDWGDSPHPSDVAEPGLALVAFAAEHPDPDSLSPVLGDLGVELVVRAGPQPALRARVAGPDGEVDLPVAGWA